MKNKKLQTIIVEDDLVIGQMQLFMLKKMGIDDPKFFRDGQEVMDYLDSEENTGQDFFILLDLNMPGMNGWGFLEASKNKSYVKKLHVVIVTSSLFKDDIIKADNYPRVIGYFQKSLSIGEFQAIIALQEKVSFSKDI